MSDGLSAIFANMDAHHKQLESKIDAAVQNAGITCEGGTKRRCPVGTPESTKKKGYKGGRLRSSYKYKRVGKMACGVGTNVSYSVWVELGTAHMRARPHLFPGFLDGKATLEEDLKSIGVG